MINWCSKPGKSHAYSNSDLKLRITALTNKHKLGHAIDTSVLRGMYADELVNHPNKIPWQIEPRPDIKFGKQKLERMIAKNIKEKVLPLFINIDESDEEASRFKAIKRILNVEDLKEAVWDVIYAYNADDRKQNGFRFTDESITKEGMTTDEIQAVL